MAWNRIAMSSALTIWLAATAASGDTQEDLDIPVADITQEDIDKAPAYLDWSKKGATTPVKDSGQCGSCWAFSTTEEVESGIFMSTGKLPELSPQQLVSCDKQDDGCDGGDIPTAFTFLKNAMGMDTHSEYPDTSHMSGRTGKCGFNKKAGVKVTGFKYAVPPCKKGNCASQAEEPLAAALAKYGPLSICINSGIGQSGDWHQYNGGVLKGICKPEANLIDHCVQLVGYDKTGAEPYWKVRNSWAADWGEDGFIRLPMGNGNACCVGCQAMIISATNDNQTRLV